MLLALSLLFVSLTILIPSVEIVIQNAAINTLHQEVNAKEVISFHTEMVSYCNNNSLECNKESFVNFDQNGNYEKFLINEYNNSIQRKKIHCYIEGDRFFTKLDRESNTPSKQVEYNLLYNSLNQYSPSYMAVGKVTINNNISVIQFPNGSTMNITGSQVSKNMHDGDIVMVS